MTLRRKTLLIVAITTICLITILYIVSRVVILDNFADLERKDTTQNVERALNTLSDDIKKLESTATDWAAWDDTWVFVQDVNPDYIEDNLQDSTLTNLGLNVMVFINSSGQIVHSKAVDLEAEEEVPAPRGLTEHIPSSGLLTSHADTESIVAGIILLPEGPMIVVSHPILTNEEEGPIAGAMIIGRFLNSGEINRLAEVARLSLSVYRLDDPNIPSDFETALTFLSADDDVFPESVKVCCAYYGYDHFRQIYLEI